MSVKRVRREWERETLEQVSFRDWLLQHGQNQRTIAGIWSLITLPILNDTVDAVSAYMGIMAFQDSLFAGKGMADIGYSRVGLSTLVSEGARTHIESRGGRLMLGRRVSGLYMHDDRVTGVRLGDDVIHADAVVSAVPWDDLERLLASGDSGNFHLPVSAPQLEWAPIVGMHIGFDRSVTELPFLTMLDSPVQWIFNRSHMQESTGDGTQQLLISISAAWR